MTTQELYNKLTAGEITEQKFLYEVRRDHNLPFITSLNSFKDAVQILKNKGIVSEKKLSTGKQDVEIYAKTIDMVNPYEYAKGMDFELGVVADSVGNRVMDGNAGDSLHIEDITQEDIIKAQKKVLKNLTKNPNYYSQKLIPQMEGETEHAVEVNAKSIEALKKKAGKIIREHGEDYEKVSKVMGNISQLEEGEIEELGQIRDSIYEKYAKKYGVDVNELKDRLEGYKASKEEAIKVDSEDAAIAIQKKDPNADVELYSK